MMIQKGLQNQSQDVDAFWSLQADLIKRMSAPPPEHAALLFGQG